MNNVMMAIYGLGMLFCTYMLGFTQAKINVHEYEEISPSIRLACTAMIRAESVDEVRDNINSYNLIREHLKYD